MKIAIITDTHVGARNDSDVFNEYFITFFEQIFFPYLEENNIDTILHLGDVFDRRKYANYRTIDLWNNRIFERLNDYNVHITLGNHDVYYKNTNRVNSVDQILKPYNFNVYRGPQTVEFDGLPILLLPWINSENNEESLKAIQETNAEICAGHLEILGFEMFSGNINYYDGLDKNIFGKFDTVMSGHFHHKSESSGIHYFGSPYHITWNDWGDSRGFHTFDTETREIEFIENPYQIFHKIYYDDSKETYESLMSYDFNSIQKMFVLSCTMIRTNIFCIELKSYDIKLS
jgi:DNA repair exonuclease SbcCD nuclease subunit